MFVILPRSYFNPQLELLTNYPSPAGQWDHLTPCIVYDSNLSDGGIYYSGAYILQTPRIIND